MNKNLICPHCGTSVQEQDFCPSCSKILPVSADRSHFEVIGYDRESLRLDPEDLEKRFFELSKKYHPDRFASKSPVEIQLSHDRSSAVNNAYRTLKDPIARAKYLVERHLGSIGEKSASVPMEMADVFFETQELLEDFQSSNGEASEKLKDQIQAAEKQLRSRISELGSELESKFTEYDASPGDPLLETIKGILSERSYIRSFLRQVDSVMNREEETAPSELGPSMGDRHGN